MRSSLPRNAGFTLIELMVVVAIVAILAAIALPNYSDYIIRSNLVEGTNQLSAYRARMEQYYQDARTYKSVTTPTAFTSPCPAGVTIKNWTYTCPALNDASYTIVATGAGVVNNFVFTIDNTNLSKTTGVKAGWGSVPANCWLMKKGQTCP